MFPYEDRHSISEDLFSLFPPEGKGYTMDISLWGTILGVGLGVVGLFVGIASLYQGSIPKRPPASNPLTRLLKSSQIFQDPEAEHKEKLSDLFFMVAFAAVALFLLLWYLFFPFIIWLYQYEYGEPYVLGFSILVTLIGAIVYLALRGRRGR